MQATPSKNNLLQHFLWLRAALAEAGCEAILDFTSFNTLVRRGAEQWLLYPKFLAVTRGEQRYAAAPGPDVTTFAGWLPYQRKHWPLAADKLAFKEYARQAQLPVPEHSTDPQARINRVLVKHAHTSFGDGIAGPFLSSTEHALQPERGEFFERFVEGKILKVWYWEGQPLCMEMDEPPSVRGDGSSTIGQLILKRASLHKAYLPEESQALLARSVPLLQYCKTSLDTVLPRGQRQIVEFRYGSQLLHPRARSVVDLRTPPDAAPYPTLMPLLRSAGLRLQAAIPAAQQRHTLFTVDAVLDRLNQPWLLEMNSNPAVHPLVYPAIVASVMGAPGVSAP
ncbi:hypothetical protein SAMN05192549_105167 [Duganella sacchari]|uniref:ATP-grasp domain-containing protein n=1 Tax=Duganella sacchari TaxID=551987 RepID=A0A1M7PK83_9BURK|nr:hypothetical protein [Duganella sacchari]SHN17636.1 hypothetical protein SAMN05192549_105167 [Duganella sacchari]